MKKILTLLLLLPVLCFSSDTDSLLNVINSKTVDVEDKCDAYFNFIWSIKNSEPEKALEYANAFLALSQKHGLDKHKASALNTLGVINRSMGNYQQTLDYQLQALRIYDSLQLKKDMATMYNNIGVTHMYNDVYEEAIKNYNKAATLADEINDLNVKNLAINNLGIIACYQESFDKGIDYFKQSLVIEKQQNNKKGISESLTNIGNVFYYINQLDSAIYYYNRSLDIERNLNNVIGMTGSLSNLGLVYSELGNIEQAEVYFKEALNLAQQHQVASVYQDILINMSTMFEQKGDFKQALFYNREFSKSRDSINSLEQSKQIAEMQTKYETEKKDEEIAHQSEVIQKEKTIRYALAGVLVLILVLSVLFYVWYKAKQQQKLQTALLKEKEKGIEAVINAQEEERQRIAKDLHDGIIQQLTSLKFGLKKAFDKVQNKETEKIFHQLEESTSELRGISHQMMPRALNDLGVVEAIEDMLNKTLSHADITFNFETFGLKERLKQNIEITLYRVCQELINNVIKHSKATEVSIQLFKSGQNVTLIVEDNGTGIDKKSASKGIGLLNISSRLDVINGKVNFEPSPNSGTLATVNIPLV